jgi:hypothetical protein
MVDEIAATSGDTKRPWFELVNLLEAAIAVAVFLRCGRRPSKTSSDQPGSPRR